MRDATSIGSRRRCATATTITSDQRKRPPDAENAARKSAGCAGTSKHARFGPTRPIVVLRKACSRRSRAKRIIARRTSGDAYRWRENENHMPALRVAERPADHVRFARSRGDGSCAIRHDMAWWMLHRCRYADASLWHMRVRVERPRIVTSMIGEVWGWCPCWMGTALAEPHVTLQTSAVLHRRVLSGRSIG